MTEMETKTATPVLRDDLFSRWLFATLELAASGVLSLLGTVEIFHVFSAMEYEGGKAQTVSVMTMLKDTQWSTLYMMVVFGFFAAVAMFAVPLIAGRFRLASALVGMLTVTVLFTACNAACMIGIIRAYAQKTIGSVPYETGLTELGVIYFIVSAFAVLELVLALRAVRRKRKEALLSCGEET